MIESIFIDSREPDWLKKLTFGDVPTTVTMLPAGDIWVACDDANMLVIERKTPNDLLNTLRDDRLFGQLVELKKQSSWAYLLITGELQRLPNGKVMIDRLTGWEWTAAMGSLLTVQELGVYVVYCAGDHDVENAVIRLSKRKRDALPIYPARANRLLTPGEQVLASLPGIGTERLDALLAARETPIQALTWLVNDRLNGIPGIGTATKQKVRDALGMDDWMELVITERSNNDG